jgi:hypothetical protein
MFYHLRLIDFFQELCWRDSHVGPSDHRSWHTDAGIPVLDDAVSPHRLEVEACHSRTTEAAPLAAREGRLGLGFQMSSAAGTFPITRAGFPDTMTPSGTSRVTTEPAATKAFSPIVTAGHSTAPPPTRAARRMRGGWR